MKYFIRVIKSYEDESYLAKRSENPISVIDVILRRHVCAHRSVVPPRPIVPPASGQANTAPCLSTFGNTLFSLPRATAEETAEKISLRLASMHSYTYVYLSGPRCSHKTRVWVRVCTYIG